MKGSKLVSTLKMFSWEELEMIDKFLASVYFQTEKNHKEIQDLFRYLLKFHSDWNDHGLEKSTVYFALFQEKEIVKGKLAKLMSSLLHEIHRFIIQHFGLEQADAVKQKMLLADFFRQRKAPKLATYYFEKAARMHSGIQIRDKQFYLNGLQFARSEISKYLIHEKLSESFDFASALLPLDVHYLLNKLDSACVLLSFDRFRKRIDLAGIISFLDGVKPHFQEQGTLNIPIIDLYYRAYEMLKKEGGYESTYWELKILINENEKNIPFESLKTLWGVARNFLIRRINKGEVHVLEELFALHKDHLEKKYLDFGDGILPSALKNIVTLGLKVKEFDWVFKFLQEYKDNIKGISSPKDVYLFNLANYHFAKREFEEALTLLADKYEDIHYKISAKRLEIKIFYESNSEVLDSKIDAFKIYIYRLPKNVILNFKREGSNHFIDMLRQLRNPKTRDSNSRQDKLMQRILKTRQLDERNWLLEKLVELKNK